MALIQMNSTQYHAAVTSGQVVLVYFWTDWHEECKEAQPTMEELGRRYGKDAVLAGINVDQEGFLALELSVYTAPTVLIYQDGAEIDRILGAQPLELYTQTMEAILHPEEVNPYELINSMGYLQ